MSLDPASWHGYTQRGWIEVICGPMFAGKTEELIRRVKRCLLANQKVAIIKPDIDKRYSSEDIVSHEGRQLKAIPIKDIKKAYDLISPDHDVLAIDEAQFFSEDIVEVSTYFANRGLRVIVAGLEMDYRGFPFGPMPQLLAVADHITKLHAVCVRCGAPALFSHRKSKEEGVVVIGSLDKYEPLCRSCFLKATSND